MSTEPLGRGRAILNDYFGTIEILIPARKNWFAILFIGFWLCGWAFGFVFGWGMSIGILFGSPFSLFTLFWSAMWTVGGAFALRTLVRMLAGKEVITVGQGELRIERRSDILYRTKTYNLADVRHLRVQDEHQEGFSRREPSGVIRFDYGMKTVRFAEGIEEAEGRAILSRLLDRHLLADRHFDS